MASRNQPTVLRMSSPHRCLPQGRRRGDATKNEADVLGEQAQAMTEPSRLVQ